jgi:hypothetical protein
VTRTERYGLGTVRGRQMGTGRRCLHNSFWLRFRLFLAVNSLEQSDDMRNILSDIVRGLSQPFNRGLAAFGAERPPATLLCCLGVCRVCRAWAP